jgi:hypothetical protein
MENTWAYKEYRIHEGMKPESRHFQYFYTIFNGTEKVCNYCVWIEDDVLSRFDSSRNFESIANSQKAEWAVWVEENIDRKDFRNLVLKHSQEGKEEIDLDNAKEKISLD